MGGFSNGFIRIINIRYLVVDARNDSSGEVLWSARIAKRYEVESGQARFATEERILMDACEEIALDLVARLPKRRVEPGRQ